MPNRDEQFLRNQGGLQVISSVLQRLAARREIRPVDQKPDKTIIEEPSIGSSIRPRNALLGLGAVMRSVYERAPGGRLGGALAVAAVCVVAPLVFIAASPTWPIGLLLITPAVAWGVGASAHFAELAHHGHGTIERYASPVVSADVLPLGKDGQEPPAPEASTPGAPALEAPPAPDVPNIPDTSAPAPVPVAPPAPPAAEAAPAPEPAPAPEIPPAADTPPPPDGVPASGDAHQRAFANAISEAAYRRFWRVEGDRATQYRDTIDELSRATSAKDVVKATTAMLKEPWSAAPQSRENLAYKSALEQIREHARRAQTMERARLRSPGMAAHGADEAPAVMDRIRKFAGEVLAIYSPDVSVATTRLAPTTEQNDIVAARASSMGSRDVQRSKPMARVVADAAKVATTQPVTAGPEVTL